MTSQTLMLPQPRVGESRDALYTDSTLALDPDTGKLVWHRQHMKRDVWDLDWVFEQSLLTVPVNGKPTELVVTGGKTAIFRAPWTAPLVNMSSLATSVCRTS